MKITKDTYRYIEDLIAAEDIEWAWKSTLKTHAHHQGFINITESAEFSEATVFNEDTLDDLGYNGVGVLYQYALSISSNASKKETGAFYTPEDIADIMAARASSGIHEQGRWTSPLLRWNSSERSELLEHIDTTLSIATMTSTTQCRLRPRPHWNWIKLTCKMST